MAAVAAAHPAAIAAAVELLPIAAVMGAIGMVGIAGIAGEQPQTFEPGTLGAVLVAQEAIADSQMNAAMAAQREGSVAAALQVRRAIARARIAMRENLAAQVASLDAGNRATLAQIDSALAALSSADGLSAKDAGERIQALADRVPVPSQVPQVRSFGPTFLFPFLPFQTLTVRGNFPAEYPDGAVPQLTLNGRVFKAYIYDAQSIGFSLPSDSIAPAEQGIAWARAELSIPWDAPRFDSFARHGAGNFVVLGLLPHSPGRVTVEHRVDVSRSEEIIRTSEAFILSAEAGESEQVACLTLTPADVAAGWKIKPGSIAPVFAPQPRGTLKEHGKVSEDERSACWRVELNPADRLVWRLSATLQRDVREVRTDSETFDLAWGGKRVFNYPAGSWTVRYAKYAGSEVRFDRADLSSPLFRVEAGARSVKVSAYPF